MTEIKAVLIAAALAFGLGWVVGSFMTFNSMTDRHCRASGNEFSQVRRDGLIECVKVTREVVR